jgi:lysosomal acid lipase/cholesteryl ester hydrolase
MIEFDLPSTIDYILSKTNTASVGYVGVSQATATMFGLLSSKPEYNAKVRPYIALAPLVRYTHTRSYMRWFPGFICHTVGAMNGRGMNTETFGPIFSGHPLENVVQKLAHLFAFCVFGFDWGQYDENRLEVVYSHPVGDFSWKTFRHHTQLFYGTKFVKYNYGTRTNRKIYGQVEPPEYRLRNITCQQVCLIHGPNDKVTAKEDIDYIRNSMTVPILVDHQIPYEKWNHTDFHFAKECGKYVNDKVLSILDSL